MNKQERIFYIAIIFSFVIHVIALTILFTIPKKSNNQSEFVELKIKLGNNQSQDVTKSQNKQSPSLKESNKTNPTKESTAKNKQNKVSKNKNNVKKTTKTNKSKKLASKKEKQQQTSKIPTIKPKPNIPRYYNTNANKHTQQQQQAKAGDMLGNAPNSTDKLAINYNQILPLWIQRYWQYPSQARSLNLEGEAEIFLKVDRLGNILYVEIEKSTGHPILNEALLETVKQASPVPPPPATENPQDKILSYRFKFRCIL